MYKSKKRICNTVISNFNINESNNFNTSNSDNVIGTSNLPHRKITNDNPFNMLVTLQNVIYIESGVSINDEIMDQNNISE